MQSIRLGKPKVISVTSGKGGVGKTLTTINLALNARRNGQRVLILDGDFGLANVDVVLGLKARYNIKDVIDGHVTLSDIILDGPQGVHVVPSGSGISSLTSLSYAQKQVLLEQTQSIESAYDLLLVDTGAGISDNVMQFNVAADQVVVVTTPEPHAMTDAYAMIKVLSEQVRNPSIHLLINQAKSADEALKVFSRISEVSQRFLQLRIMQLGHVPYDPEVPMRVLKRRIGSHDIAHTLAGQAWAQLGQRLFGHSHTKSEKRHDDVDIWHRLIVGVPTPSMNLSV